ncbi:MAG TPA: DUF447 domain-containing protein [Gemmataceae bacterium]|jgi:hypothetical protein
MILEGIVTTISALGEVNIAPMGPHVEDEPANHEWTRFTLRPFRTSQTFANLMEHNEGVLHVTDDVLLLARSALGMLDPLPPLLSAEKVRGWVLADCCRYYEFRVGSCDVQSERASFEAEVVHSGRLRDFFGFNRAKHAVLEAAILATRTAFLPLDEIEAEYSKLAVLVEKTGGSHEHAAFNLLRRHVQQVKKEEPLPKERLG